MTYERKNISQISGYVPGEQPRTTDVIKLNTNENPYPPSPDVMHAIRQVDEESLRRYPSPLSGDFRRLAAEVHQVKEEQIIATNGGDELLRLAITVFTEPGSQDGRGGIGSTKPTYSLYPILAAIQDTSYMEIPLKDDFDLPDDFAQKLNSAGCKLAMIVNPHAPSGRLFELEKIKNIAQEFKGVLLIDEAYVDFADTNALPLIRQDKQALDNVLILRSFSKGYSLAGLRFGYGMGHPNLIAAMDKARDSYNINAITQAGAVAALKGRAYSQVTQRKVIIQRPRVSNQLRKMGWHVYPSQSNFILATPPKTATAPSAKEIYLSLKKSGIFVRYFDMPHLDDKLRITIGAPRQNDALIEYLGKLKTPY